MKKLLLVSAILLLCTFFFGCNKDKDDLTIANESELTQTAYADDENTGNGFTFTAKNDWTATAKTGSTTKGSGVSWLKLMNNGIETYSGGAGTFTLVITLEKNTTGQTRTASIEIMCGKDKITISVTQSGTNNFSVLKLPALSNVVGLELFGEGVYLPVEYSIKDGYFVVTLPETLVDSSSSHGGYCYCYLQDLSEDLGEVTAANMPARCALLYGFLAYDVVDEWSVGYAIGQYSVYDEEGGYSAYLFYNKRLK